MMKSAVKPFRFLFLLGIVHAQINLASNGTASQSSTYVVDGYSYMQAWRLLENPHTTGVLSHVLIPEEMRKWHVPNRLSGYSLYITNNASTIPPSDGLCYHHKGNETPSLVQNITCNQMGKYVIIYNERKTGVPYPKGYSDVALLELCDVQIIGCYKSWWGDGCRQPCPSYCIDNHCYPDNGTCVWGCNSNNCINNDCTNDGICTVGCIKGYAGIRCTKLEVQCDGVPVSLFVSLLLSVIVIAFSIICGTCMFYRRQYGALPRRHNNDGNKYDDLNVNKTHKMKAEVNETTYEELGKNA